MMSKVSETAKRSKEESIGIWSIFITSGRVPADVTPDELDAIGDMDIKVKDATSLINGILFKERQIIEQLITDNGVKDIILRDVLGVTDEDFNKAIETRELEIKAFEDEMKAQFALAQAELASKADKKVVEG